MLFVFLILFIYLLVCASDKRIANEGEYSDSEDEGEGRRNEKSYKSPRKKVKPGSPIANMVADATKSEDKKEKTENDAVETEESNKEKGEQ